MAALDDAIGTMAHGVAHEVVESGTALGVTKACDFASTAFHIGMQFALDLAAADALLARRIRDFYWTEVQRADPRAKAERDAMIDELRRASGLRWN